MKSYIPLETATIFFSGEPLSEQGISSEYAMVDFICMGLLDLWWAWTENYNLKILAHSWIRTWTFRLWSERAKRDK